MNHFPERSRRSATSMATNIRRVCKRPKMFRLLSMRGKRRELQIRAPKRDPHKRALRARFGRLAWAEREDSARTAVYAFFFINARGRPSKLAEDGLNCAAQCVTGLRVIADQCCDVPDIPTQHRFRHQTAIREVRNNAAYCLRIPTRTGAQTQFVGLEPCANAGRYK